MNTSLKTIIISVVVGLTSGAAATVLIFGAVIACVIAYPRDVEHLLHLSEAGNSITTQIADSATEDQVVSVVDTVKPAVVSIVATGDVPVYEEYSEPSQIDPNNPFGGMMDPFGGMMNLPQYKQNGTQKQEVSSGSGFFVTGDGYVITNKHVVDQDNVDYTVITNDGTKYDAKVVAKDPSNDIAIMKVDKADGASDFPYLNFGDSSQIKVGQTAIAIGNALGEFSNSVSVGVVSGLARSIQAGDGNGQSEQLQGVIQTDAAINFGNSGGPLLNISGQVIGVDVAMAQGTQNVAFALPANLVKAVVDQVKTTGKITRPFLGVRYTMIDDTVKTKNNLSVDYGALVRSGKTNSDLAVVPGSPADKAGIVENDIILEIDGQKIDADHDLASLITQHNVGDTVTLHILDKGNEKDVSVTLEAKQ